jgi:membrane-bound lytic murein transglycosylase B
VRVFIFVALLVFFSPLAQPALGRSGENFSVWLQQVRQEALAQGISKKTVRAALPNSLKPVEKIIRLDRTQPEGTKTFHQYFQDTITSRRIDDGRARYLGNKSLLSKVGADYGVDPQYVVALWGIETNFGRNTGGYDLVTALATLAWDGRRSDYFRQELMKALKILDNGDVPLKDMKGSWAGAMGQTQFMPSSFFKFAQDYNKDGKRDIWKDKADVFASAANYLSQSGWKKGEPWGRRVKLPDGFNRALIGLDTMRSLSFWHEQGVRMPQGESVPFEGAYQASLIQPDGHGTAAFLVYNNFRVIMKWNKSTYFATSVGLLADRIKG